MLTSIAFRLAEDEGVGVDDDDEAVTCELLTCLYNQKETHKSIRISNATKSNSQIQTRPGSSGLRGGRRRRGVEFGVFDEFECLRKRRRRVEERR